MSFHILYRQLNQRKRLTVHDLRRTFLDGADEEYRNGVYDALNTVNKLDLIFSRKKNIRESDLSKEIIDDFVYFANEDLRIKKEVIQKSIDADEIGMSAFEEYDRMIGYLEALQTFSEVLGSRNDMLHGNLLEWLKYSGVMERTYRKMFRDGKFTIYHPYCQNEDKGLEPDKPFDKKITSEV